MQTATQIVDNGGVTWTWAAICTSVKNSMGSRGCLG